MKVLIRTDQGRGAWLNMSVNVAIKNTCMAGLGT